MGTNFKQVGTWWNDHSIELVELADGEVYALNGWNGEEYTGCWKCSGEYNMDASTEEYILRPIYDTTTENDNGGYDIIGYVDSSGHI